MSDFKNPYSSLLAQSGVLIDNGFFNGKLFDLGEYPTAIQDENSKLLVHGEIWQLTDFKSTVYQLDHYEGVFDTVPAYTRQQIKVSTASNQVYECWIYLCCTPTYLFHQILSGDYKKR